MAYSVFALTQNRHFYSTHNAVCY